MTARLSIITPSYQQGAFLERTIRSVLDQGYPDLEYLIADGGSTDESVDIIRRYEDRLAWWVSEPDDGQTDALNKALQRATGAIVAYVNSDDYYLPGAFDHAVAALSRSDAWWAVGASRFVDEADQVTEVWRPKLPPSTARYWWSSGPWGVPQPSTFWRRECFDRYGFFRRDMHYVFDTEHGLRLAFAGHLPEIIDAELAVRVVHPAAKSWDITPFRREARAMEREYRRLLTPAERAAYALKRPLAHAGVYRAVGRLVGALRGAR